MDFGNAYGLYLFQYNFKKDEIVLINFLFFKLSDNYMQNHDPQALKIADYKSIE